MFVRLSAHPLRWRLLAELAHSDYRVRELVTLVGEPQSLVSYHLRLLRNGGLVTTRAGSFDGRDSYYHLDLDRCAAALADTGIALHPALGYGIVPRILPADSAELPSMSVFCSCVPATAPAHRSPRPCCATAPTGGPRWSALATGPRPTYTPAPSVCCTTSSASISPASAPGAWTRSMSAASTT